MSLSANLKAALLGARPGNFWLLELSTPDATRRYASQGYASVGSGHFAGLVLHWGDITYEISDSSGAMRAVETQVEIDDTSRDWTQLVEGAYGDQVVGSAATIYRAHPDCAGADWCVAFTGEISSWDWSGPMRATLRLRVSDGPFLRDVPSANWLVSRAEFSNAAADAINKLAPVIYGVHDSSLYGSEGMVPALRVGAGQYLLSAGWLKAVDVVYTDGVTEAAADYTVSHPVIGGRQYTRIDYDADPGEDAIVTADVQGYEATGDGSGALIEDPLDQLAHFITNFVVGDYQSGEWLVTSSIVDAATFASTYYSDRDYSAAYYMGARKAGYDVLADWSRSNGAAVYWTPSGTVAAAVEDPTETDIYPTTTRLQDKSMLTFRIIRDDRDRTSSLTINYVLDTVANEYRLNQLVTEPQQADDYPLTVDLPWSWVQ